MMKSQSLENLSWTRQIKVKYLRIIIEILKIVVTTTAEKFIWKILYKKTKCNW